MLHVLRHISIMVGILLERKTLSLIPSPLHFNSHMQSR